MRYRVAMMWVGAWMAAGAWAQGEDSLRSARDLMVIDQMLPGTYANANQTYFEGRTSVPEEFRHPGLRIDIAGAGNFSYEVTVEELGSEAEPGRYQIALALDSNQDQVLMSIVNSENVSCDYRWQREAQQFRATPATGCGENLPMGLVVSEQQLWVEPSTGGNQRAGAFQLHRARKFGCYADIPGVGGGRDIPYERYDGIELHDQWDSHWFDTRDDPPRRMGITLALVDWPINNYKGVFTRDSLVIYVSEEINGERKEHGYAFTVPEADRVGVNLKWILASCFMVPNSHATPKM